MTGTLELPGVADTARKTVVDAETKQEVMTRLQHAFQFGFPEPLRPVAGLIRMAMNTELPKRLETWESAERRADGTPVRSGVRESDPNIIVYITANNALVAVERGHSCADHAAKLRAIADDLREIIIAKERYEKLLSDWKKALPVAVLPPVNFGTRRY